MIKKSAIIGFSILSIIVVFSIIFLVIFLNKQNTNTDTDTNLNINKISQYYNTETINQISNPLSGALIAILRINGSENIPNDITIRDNTPITYQFNSQTKFYSGDFILDIPSIQQSYHVSFSIPQDKNTTYINPVEVQCISDKNLIIYRNFQCINRGQH